ncbi:unnamed protein product [Prorocentrum cordatum]|uniref:Uncharacterized protein n=1 Tax=Prorocentrum cordatum TaxID=2364126 RepID=A0ABN9QRF8_9DINO|nr:unnamed protein product [Polarella glacialis]
MASSRSDSGCSSYVSLGEGAEHDAERLTVTVQRSCSGVVPHPGAQLTRSQTNDTGELVAPSRGTLRRSLPNGFTPGRRESHVQLPIEAVAPRASLARLRQACGEGTFAQRGSMVSMAGSPRASIAGSPRASIAGSPRASLRLEEAVQRELAWSEKSAGEWCARLMSTIASEGRREACVGIVGRFQALLPQDQSLTSSDKFHLTNIVEDQIEAQQRVVSQQAFIMVKRELLELAAIRGEMAELENRMMAMNTEYTREVTATRDSSRPPLETAREGLSTGDLAEKDVQFYEPMQYLSNEARKCVHAVVDEKLKAIVATCAKDRSSLESLLRDRLASSQTLNSQLQDELRELRQQKDLVEENAIALKQHSKRIEYLKAQVESLQKSLWQAESGLRSASRDLDSMTKMRDDAQEQNWSLQERLLAAEERAEELAAQDERVASLTSEVERLQGLLLRGGCGEAAGTERPPAGRDLVCPAAGGPGSRRTVGCKLEKPGGDKLGEGQGKPDEGQEGTYQQPSIPATLPEKRLGSRPGRHAQAELPDASGTSSGRARPQGRRTPPGPPDEQPAAAAAGPWASGPPGSGGVEEPARHVEEAPLGEAGMPAEAVAEPAVEDSASALEVGANGAGAGPVPEENTPERQARKQAQKEVRPPAGRPPDRALGSQPTVAAAAGARPDRGPRLVDRLLAGAAGPEEEEEEEEASPRSPPEATGTQSEAGRPRQPKTEGRLRRPRRAFTEPEKSPVLPSAVGVAVQTPAGDRSPGGSARGPALPGAAFAAMATAAEPGTGSPAEGRSPGGSARGPALPRGERSLGSCERTGLVAVGVGAGLPTTGPGRLTGLPPVQATTSPRRGRGAGPAGESASQRVLPQATRAVQWGAPVPPASKE